MAWASRQTPGIFNLAINARDAMPGGGCLTIHAGNAVLGEAEAKLHETKPWEYVRVSVTDTGGGMVSEVMEHVTWACPAG